MLPRNLQKSASKPRVANSGSPSTNRASQTSAENSAEAYPKHPESGAEFMPWCRPVSPADFLRWRDEVIDMIERLSAIERWPRDHLDDVLVRAVNGPVSDLRPNWHYFREQLKAIDIRMRSEDL